MGLGLGGGAASAGLLDQLIELNLLHWPAPAMA
ncbi:hypothetical protein SSTU70S_00327 [Stutzerimonas stutzeri]